MKKIIVRNVLLFILACFGLGFVVGLVEYNPESPKFIASNTVGVRLAVYRTDVKYSKKAASATPSNSFVKERVKKYFHDIPTLIKIARCESGFKHFGKDGNALRGRITPKDTGVMQINLYYHGKTARELGLDVRTLEGNMAYAKWLYKKEGTRPWKSSSKCWRT